MFSNRYVLIAALLLGLVALPSQAAQSVIYRVNGVVSDKNYKGFEAFLFNSLDSVVGLKLRFEQNDGHQDGQVSASQSGNQFVAYRPGANSESEIVANEGFSFQRGGYVFDGFFVVKSGGMHQGIISLFLDPVEDATVLLSDAPVKDIDVGRLRADIRN